MEQVRHVVGLILDALAIVRVPGGHDEVPHPLPAQLRLVEAAGGGVEPGLCHGPVQGEDLAEAVHGAALLFAGDVVAGDPCGGPVSLIQKAHLKELFGPVPGPVVLVPQAHLPGDPLPAREGQGVLCVHLVALHLPGLPLLGDDLVGFLLHAPLGIPHEPGLLDVDAQGVEEMLGFQTDGVHVTPPSAARAGP